MAQRLWERYRPGIVPVQAEEKTMTRARARGARAVLTAGAGALLCLVAPGAAFADGPARGFDFDGDGHDDLAVGVPGESVGSTRLAGAVNVLQGTPSGPTAARDRLWSQASAGIAGAAEFGDRFGSVVASADFDGDGHADLAVGVPGESEGSKLGSGAVDVLYGTASGLASARDQIWSQGSKGVPGSVELGDHFGSVLAAGDFDGDGYGDLAVGVPTETVAGSETPVDTGTGLVNVLYGSRSGLSSKGAQSWTQDSKGVRGSTEFNDEFGSSLASADVDGDGYDELAVGVPQENFGQAGAVQLLRGSNEGLTAKGNQLWSQDSEGVADSEEGGDRFGDSLAFGDFNRDGRPDLAIGVPGEVLQPCEECEQQGAVEVLLGAADGLTATGSQFWHVGDPGLPGHVGEENSFGAALTSGDFNGDGAADLAVAAPGATVRGRQLAGAVHVLDGSSTGLRARGFVLTQDSPGVPGEPEVVGGSHTTLAARRFGGSYDALVVGLPGVTVSGQDTAGAVLVVPGSAGGLDPRSSAEWTQDSPGIEDHVEADDQFGHVGG